MKKIRSINFHVGFPRVGPNLTKSIGEHFNLKDNGDVLFVSHAYFRANLRTVINTYHLGRREELNGAMRMEEFERDCADFGTIVMSQSSLLGYPRDLLAQGRLRNRALTRVRSLSCLFDAMPLTLHLLIEPQADYLARLLSSQAITISHIRPFSWYELTNGIQGQLGEHKLMIWDYREPEQMEEVFFTAMAGNKLSIKASATRRILRRVEQESKQRQREDTFAGHAKIMQELDDLYHDDLRGIDRIPGVQLIRSRNP